VWVRSVTLCVAGRVWFCALLFGVVFAACGVCGLWVFGFVAIQGLGGFRCVLELLVFSVFLVFWGVLVVCCFLAVCCFSGICLFQAVCVCFSLCSFEGVWFGIIQVSVVLVYSGLLVFCVFRICWCIL